MKTSLGLGQAGLVLALSTLGACGGGSGGVGSTPAPLPAPAPTPTPAPAPAPAPTPAPTPVATNFDTAEYRRSDGPSFHGAVTAWQAGASGSGATIAIIDSGIDTTNAEFAGRIAASSRDVVGSRQLTNADDDHGTQVALVAAAARNGSGVVGIAWSANLQMLRADTPGSCGSSGECSFSDTAIASGINAAVQEGARVINLSLGGDPANASLRSAIARAASSGAVIIVSAGNDGDSTESGVDPLNPDPFATSVLQAGGSNVIVVGSVNENGVVSGFSNRPGASATSVLMALGERVCCVYDGSTPKTTTNAEGTFVTLVSGTSFAAPQVSGAAALLAQAFPNLTGAQIVDLLLRSARDAGAAGTDGIYGRGILDIARAFSPQGSLALAGTTVAITPTVPAGTLGTAMGDAVTGASLGSVMLDGYRRAYSLDLSQGLRSAPSRLPLHDALASAGSPVGLKAGDMSLAFTVDRRFGALPMRLEPGRAAQARMLASTIVARVAPSLEFGMGWNVRADSLAAQLQHRQEPQFLVAGVNGNMPDRPDSALAMRYRLGKLGLTASAERGALGPAQLASGQNMSETRKDRMMRLGLALDGALGSGQSGPSRWRLGLGLMREERTVLGARFAPALGGGGATSYSFAPGLDWQPAPGWNFAASASLGLTRPDAGSVALRTSRLITSQWMIDLARYSVFVSQDRLAMRISQPLRVEHGGLYLNLPVAWDYATQSATFARIPLSLTPKGREIDGEIVWSTRLPAGDITASLFGRRNPGHIAGARIDAGLALRWSGSF